MTNVEPQPDQQRADRSLQDRNLLDRIAGLADSESDPKAVLPLIKGVLAERKDAYYVQVAARERAERLRKAWGVYGSLIASGAFEAPRDPKTVRNSEREHEWEEIVSRIYVIYEALERFE